MDEVGREEMGEGLTRDISSVGVYIVAARRLPPPGALVKLDIMLPHLFQAVRDMHVHAKGRVARVDRDELSTGARGFAVENHTSRLRERKKTGSTRERS